MTESRDLATPQHVRRSTNGGVATLTIDSPPLNLLGADLMTALDAHLTALREDPATRVIVFESADTDFFIAHGDMAILDDPEAFARLPVAAEQDPALNPMMRLNEKIRGMPQLTIAKIRGMVRGGGAELVTSMDIRFASRERAALAQMEAPTGIIPGAGATAYLPHLIGRARTLEVILGSALIDAPTAARWGWVNRAVPDDELDDFVTDFAHRVSGLPDGVLAATKRAVDASLRSLREGLETENAELGQLFAKPIAADLTRAALAAGSQTRAGERDLESVLDRIRPNGSLTHQSGAHRRASAVPWRVNA